MQAPLAAVFPLKNFFKNKAGGDSKELPAASLLLLNPNKNFYAT